MAREIVAADLTWIDGAFRPGVQVAVGEDGRVEAVGELGLDPTRRLAGQALLPGFVNAHSHAFQRGLRGRSETFPEAGGSFWTWREAMYRLVEGLDEEGFFRWTLQAFQEMRAAGITAVGEFHYLHHGPGGPDFAFDEVVLRAAARAGIRLVLLNACYRTGGAGRALAGGQRRFETPSLEIYWEQMDRLERLLDPATQSLGAAAHSLRAVPPEEVAELYRGARRRGLAFHLHVEEQRREIEEVAAAYGETPMALLNDRLEISPGVTAVHCTHTEGHQMERFAAAGGNVCLCPLTEANLGDGIPDVPGILAAGGSLGLGTDSNARISMLEEMRWLEYTQRLARERRGVVRDEQGRVGPALLEAATAGGARCLGLPAGRTAPGAWADLVALDLGHPALAGCHPEILADVFVLGAGEEAIRASCVGGRWLEHRPGPGAAG